MKRGMPTKKEMNLTNSVWEKTLSKGLIWSNNLTKQEKILIRRWIIKGILSRYAGKKFSRKKLMEKCADPTEVKKPFHVSERQFDRYLKNAEIEHKKKKWFIPQRKASLWKFRLDVCKKHKHDLQEKDFWLKQIKKLENL